MIDPMIQNRDQYDILIVDDTPDSLELLVRILDDGGYHVRPAPNGRHALKSVAARLPDLILLDVKMPEMDGYEVCRRLKSDEMSRTVPVIFISSYGDTAKKVEGFKAGGVDFITKPFEAAEVLARVEIHLQLHELTEQLEQKITGRTEELHAANAQLQHELAERKRAEEKRRRAERQLKAIIMNFPDFISRFDDQCRFLYINPAIEKRIGYSSEQCFGKTLFDINAPGPPGQNEKLHAAIKQTFEQASQNTVEAVWPTPEGERLFEVRHFPELIEDGKVVSVIGVTRDITERRRAEEEIAWNLAINQALSSLYIPLAAAGTSIEQIADAVLDKSRQLTGSAHGYVAEIDPATGDLIAHTNTKMLQTECKIAQAELRKIRFPRRADGLYNGLWGHALNTKEPFYTNGPAKHPALVGVPEGHIAMERFLTVPVLLAGELAGQIALSNPTRAYTDQDLDAIDRIAEFYALAIQHKRAEEQIRILNQELEQRVVDRTAKLEAVNKELEAFAYSVSHDLRAPLRHIDGFLDLLQKRIETTLDEQSRSYMDTISGAANKMALLIDDLLSLSRMGRHAMSLQPVELVPLVREIITEFEPDAAGRTIDWRVGDMPTVSGDAAMLQMVLANLISNAMKFTRPRDKARIEIGSLPRRDTEAVIFVRDNGVGLDMAYADKLFGVFQRLHREEEFEGTGIGLANVRRIITRHGGRTWAEGEINQGATFYFSLPRAIQGA